MSEVSAPSGRFVIITGLSGSGKSTVLHALEDLGYYAVDNLPVDLLEAFVRLPLRRPFKAALVMDARSSGFAERFPALFSRLREEGYPLELVFLEAQTPALISRFSTTRRPHPMAGAGRSLEEAIALERRLLGPVKSLATRVLDTTPYNVHQLRRQVFDIYSSDASPGPMPVNIVTFGFSGGLPAEADIVMDVRFLPNPYFVEGLRELDGRHPQVVNFLLRQQPTREFLKRLEDLVLFLLPLYQKEGKSQLTIAIGCTGGRHRSVAIAGELAKRLEANGYKASVRHRDLAGEGRDRTGDNNPR